MLTWKQRIGILAGNAFEFYDIAVYAAISPYLTEILEREGVSHALLLVWGIFALRFLVRPFGGALIGWFADTKGRKAALILTSSLTGTATLLMACLPTHTAWIPALPIMLLILQMLQAFSFGGEYPTAIAYLLRNEEKQATVSAAIVASSVAGVLLSLIVTGLLTHTLTKEDMLTFGWRVPLALGAINIAVTFWFRWRLAADTPTIRQKGVISARQIVRIFLLTIPAAVVFYVQSLSSTIVKTTLPDGFLKDNFPLLSNMGLFVVLLLVGLCITRWSTPDKAMRLGIFGLIFLGIPLYVGLGSPTILIVIGSQLALTLIAALILTSLAAVLYKEAAKSDRPTAVLGLGYNFALSIFGGLSPLFIAALLPIGHFWAGLYVAASGLAYVLAIYLPEQNAKKAELGK